jgi:hypothetical protein
MDPMIRRTLALATAALLVLSPAAAVAAPAFASPAQTPGCDVDAAGLTWGFKESFRAYIDGSIANGEWTVADGVSYETPDFSWADGTGTVGAHDLSGSLAFTGSVRFTGHGGILDTTIANPVIRFDDPQHATLLLDVTGATMEGDPYSGTAVPFVTLDLSAVGVVTRADDVVRIDAAPTTLTAEGAIAFPNYEAGTDFDPVTVEFTVAPECDLGIGVIGDATAFLLIVLSLAGALVVAVIVLAVVRVRRRRRGES